MKMFVQAIVLLILSLIIGIPMSFYSAFVLSHLWTWFAEPIFHITFTVSQFVGLNFIVGYILMGIMLAVERVGSKLDECNEFSDRMAHVIGLWITSAVMITFMWVAGFVYHQFV